MFGLSLGHLVILGIVVLMLKQKSLPEYGLAFGKGLSAFRKGLEGKKLEN